ncbi:MAG: lysozyme [Pseudomonadota bacterium]
MAARRRLSKSGLKLLKRFEGFRAAAAPLADDESWVIGYSHTQAAREGLTLTEAEADALLREHDLPPIEVGVLDSVLTPLGQNEFDALVMFVFSIGLDAFRVSEVLSALNAGDRLSAADAMLAWRKAESGGKVIVVDALVRRRATERALFLEPDAGPVSASSAIFRPQLDLAASFVRPQPNQDPSGQTGALDQAISEPAREVGRRLGRILGAGPSAPVPDEASVEEITRAVSAIADPVPDDDLAETAPPSNHVEIDDLAEAPVPASPVAAPSNGGVGIAPWAPLAVVFSLGLALLFWGALDWLALTERASGNRLAGLYMLLLGLLLSAQTGYYLFRAFAAPGRS